MLLAWVVTIGVAIVLIYFSFAKSKKKELSFVVSDLPQDVVSSYLEDIYSKLTRISELLKITKAQNQDEAIRNAIEIQNRIHCYLEIFADKYEALIFHIKAMTIIEKLDNSINLESIENVRKLIEGEKNAILQNSVNTSHERLEKEYSKISTLLNETIKRAVIDGTANILNRIEPIMDIKNEKNISLNSNNEITSIDDLNHEYDRFLSELEISL